MLDKILYSTIFVLFLFIGNPSFAQQETAEINTPPDSLQEIQQIVSEKSDAIISYAKKFMGVPYVWGGMSPSGFDCSGFINYVFKGFGFGLTRTSYGLAELGKNSSLIRIATGRLNVFSKQGI